MSFPQVVAGLHQLPPSLLCSVARAASHANVPGRRVLYQAICHRVLAEEQGGSLIQEAPQHPEQHKPADEKLQSGHFHAQQQRQPQEHMHAAGSPTTPATVGEGAVMAAATTSRASSSPGREQATWLSDQAASPCTSFLVLGLPFAMRRHEIKQLITRLAGGWCGLK